jgi:hypothetical protein
MGGSSLKLRIDFVTNSSSASFSVVSKNGKGFSKALKLRIADAVIDLLGCDPMCGTEYSDGSLCVCSSYELNSNEGEDFLMSALVTVMKEIDKTKGFSASVESELGMNEYWD